MHEVNVQGLEAVHCNIDRVMRQLVELCLCFAPIEGVVPVFCKSLYICEGRTVGPSNASQFIREIGQGKLLLQQGKLVLVDIDLVRVDCRHSSINNALQRGAIELPSKVVMLERKDACSWDCFRTYASRIMDGQGEL